MWPGRRFVFVAVVVMGLGTAAARAADERAIVLNFTPTERAQIAIWMDWVDHQPGVRMCTAQNPRWPCRPNGDNEPIVPKPRARH